MTTNVHASPQFIDTTARPAGQKIVLICDWLPPDFGAVGQYTLQRASQLARDGHHVSVVGFSSEIQQTDQSLPLFKILRVQCGAYDKNSLIKRALWTLSANIKLLSAVRPVIKAADEVVFTGSPPYFLHFIVPANFLFWRKKLVYRITDFHPECLMAEFARVPFWLKAIYQLTLFWRRRVAVFEAIGEDQKTRLAAINIAPERIRVVRDPSPVAFSANLPPQAKPVEFGAMRSILYSGNFGVAHDDKTFIDGYAAFSAQHPGRAKLWLNAVGKKADLVERACGSLNLAVYRSQPVPLNDLPALLISADLHLITLRDAFVGFVLPSKVYACIDSRRPILFIGSAKSDVHLLCSTRVPLGKYLRVDVGDVQGVSAALHELLPA
jgi:hypothetical protein